MDDTLSQVVDHTYAVIIWILKYIDENKLPVTDDESWPSFKHHLIRLTSIVRTLDYPLPKNPLLSDESLHKKKSDEDLTEPRGTSLICQNCIVLRLEQ